MPSLFVWASKILREEKKDECKLCLEGELSVLRRLYACFAYDSTDKNLEFDALAGVRKIEFYVLYPMTTKKVVNEKFIPLILCFPFLL